jgi:hypothetical protein
MTGPQLRGAHVLKVQEPQGSRAIEKAAGNVQRQRGIGAKASAWGPVRNLQGWGNFLHNNLLWQSLKLDRRQ